MKAKRSNWTVEYAPVQVHISEELIRELSGDMAVWKQIRRAGLKYASTPTTLFPENYTPISDCYVKL